MGPVTLLLLVLPFAVLDHFFTSGGEVFRMAGSALVVGSSLALFLPRRMVIAAIGGAVGSLAAAVLTTQSGLFLPFLALAATFIAVGTIAFIRVTRKSAPKTPGATPHDL